MHELGLHVVYAVLVYAALSLLQVLLHRIPVLRRMPFALNLLFLLLTAKLFLDPYLAEIHPYVRSGAEAALVCVSAYVVLRLFDILIFEFMVQRRRRRPVPVVVRDIVRWLAFALTAFLIVRSLFPDLNLSILAVSSIVVGYIVGNATQDTLGNLISGLALNTETPFSIGDWIVVGEKTGRVVQMTWRATRLQTKTNDYVVIPNSVIAKDPIVNYSQPTPVHGLYFKVGVSYDGPPNVVRRVLREAMAAVPDVLQDPAPKVFLDDYSDFAIIYRIKMFIADFEHLDDIKSQVMDLIWYYFKREGLTIPFPIRDVRITQAVKPSDDVVREQHVVEYTRLLGTIDLFNPLSEEERAQVATHLRETIYGLGEHLVREGETGETFYIIRSGRVKVSVRKGDEEVVVAHLESGNYFGEMSLLTGEKRNATITATRDTLVLELSHKVLADLLRQNSRLAEDLAVQIEKRQKERGQSIEAAAAHTANQSGRTSLANRIRNFFGLA